MKVTIIGSEKQADRVFRHWALSKEYTLVNGATEMDAKDYQMLIATHGSVGIRPVATTEEVLAARQALTAKLIKAKLKKAGKTRQIKG